MFSLIILIIFALNLFWAVINWKNEWLLVEAVYKQWRYMDKKLLIIAPALLIGDLTITGAATSIFGFAGFQGSAMAILMSNLLSISFFTPKGEAKLILKKYKKEHKNELGKI